MGICTSLGLRVRGNSENGVTERDGFLTNRKAEKSNWTPVSIALSSTRKGFTGLYKHSFMVFAKAFQDMGRRMLMPYPDIQSLWLPNATHIRKTFPKTYPQKSPTQLISEHSSKLQKRGRQYNYDAVMTIKMIVVTIIMI